MRPAGFPAGAPHTNANRNIMDTLTQIFILLVAAEHLYIMLLETLRTTSEHTARTFSLRREDLNNPHIRTLLKNQGVYNGLLALLLVFSAVGGDMLWARLLLLFVVCAAAYGSLTSDRRIILRQGGPAILALTVSFIS